LIGIFSGFVVVFGLFIEKRLDSWTAVSLITTAATSVTGFFFPFNGFTPADAFGIISLIVLPIAIFARYMRQGVPVASPTPIWICSSKSMAFIDSSSSGS